MAADLLPLGRRQRARLLEDVLRQQLLAHVPDQRGQADPLGEGVLEPERAGDPLGQAVDVRPRLHPVAQGPELAAFLPASVAHERKAQEALLPVEGRGRGMWSLVRAHDPLFGTCRWKREP